MGEIQRALRWARGLQGTFLITIPLYTYVLSLLPIAEHSVWLTIVAALAALSIADVAVTKLLHARNITRAIEALRVNPEDTLALRKWRSGVLISLANAESVALFGVLLKFLGGSWRMVGPFFAAAVLLFLVWSPKLDIQPGG